jgi:hypothetical protein
MTRRDNPQELTRTMYLLFLSTAYPLWRLLNATARTSLRSASYWTFAAWVSWGLFFFGLASRSGPDAEFEIRYLALCLTSCTGVAVLGARHPHAVAWNAVVFGFLAVMITPWVEHRVLGTPLVRGLRAWFLGGTLAVCVLNYLPTRFVFAAILVGIGCTSELVKLCNIGSPQLPILDTASAGLLFAPWAALCSRPPPTVEASHALWIDFRDRYGLLWSLRAREQFNASMQHAGIPVRLAWRGLVPLPDSCIASEQQKATAAETLRALRKRFMPENGDGR